MAPHLRQIKAETVAALCDRVEAIASSYAIRLETEAFRESRTPWDGTRLANILFHHDRSNKDLQALVRDIDQAAEDCAELIPNNRDPERL